MSLKRCGLVVAAGVAAAVVWMTGCSSAAPEPVSESGAARARRIETQARSTGEELLKAFIADDSDRFIALLPVDARRQFGPDEFKRTRATLAETIGTPEKFEFITGLDAPVFKSHLWKVTFRRQAVLNQEQEFRQETLFRVVTGELDGKPYIVSFGFL